MFHEGTAADKIMRDERIPPGIRAALAVHAVITASAKPSPAMREHDRRMATEREQPLLALAYLVEAAGDRRYRNDIDAMSLLTELRDEARRLVSAYTGEAFTNPLYR